MKKIFFVLLGALFTTACARVTVQAPKEPIRVDVSMRMDIYQHVAKDIDNIEDQVSGAGEKAAVKDKHSLLDYIISDAYADGGLDEAIARRRDRRAQLVDLEAKGTVGENRTGFVEVKQPDPAAQALVQAENGDRTVIYDAVAQKNGTSVDDVQKLYAKRLQADAPAGTPVEGDSGWTVK